VLVAGMLGTKDSEGFLRNFAGLAYALIAVPVQGQMAGRPPEEVAATATRLGIPASIAYSAEAALAEIAARPWDRAPRVLVCGSLYMAGDVLAANGTPPV
jgi:dihydrofolate synthase/folylpolyglutamate synthase